MLHYATTLNVSFKNYKYIFHKPLAKKKAKGVSFSTFVKGQ